MTRYRLDEPTYILARFPTGCSPTITIYNLANNSVIINAASMAEVSTTGTFKYLFSETPVVRTEYLWIATDTYTERQGKIVRGGYPEEIADDIAAIEVAVGLTPGGTKFTYILSDDDDLPIADAVVWVTTDANGDNTIQKDITNAFGQVVFWVDPGTYYVWRRKYGYTLENPDIETVT